MPGHSRPPRPRRNSEHGGAGAALLERQGSPPGWQAGPLRATGNRSPEGGTFAGQTRKLLLGPLEPAGFRGPSDAQSPLLGRGNSPCAPRTPRHKGRTRAGPRRPGRRARRTRDPERRDTTPPKIGRRSRRLAGGACPRRWGLGRGCEVGGGDAGRAEELSRHTRAPFVGNGECASRAEGRACGSFGDGQGTAHLRAHLGRWHAARPPPHHGEPPSPRRGAWGGGCGARGWGGVPQVLCVLSRPPPRRRRAAVARRPAASRCARSAGGGLPAGAR